MVGSHLLYELLQRHDRVRAIHREDSDLDRVKRVFGYYSTDAEKLFHRIEWHCANVLDLPQLAMAFRDVTHVFHAAAYINFNPSNYSKLRKANVEGTANVVNLCISHGVRKLCYVSSVATLGTSMDGGLIDEETHWNPEAKNSVYAITKYGAEMEVWRATQEGVPAVIVNPSVILGPGFWGSGSGAIISLAARGTTYFTPGGTGVVDVRDVARAMVQLMDSEIANQRFVLNAENCSFKHLITHLAKSLNSKAPTREVPKWIGILASWLDGFSSVIFGTKHNLPRATVRSLFTVSQYDGSKIKRHLPHFKYTDFSETVAHISETYRNDRTS